MTSRVAEPLGLPDLQLDQQVDLDGVLQRVVDEVARQLDADRGTLYLVDHARGELVSRVAHLPELSEIRLRLGEGVAGWVARNGELVNSNRLRDDSRFAARIDAMTGYQTRSVLAAPVFLRPDEVVGVLQVLNKRNREGFAAADERRLVELATEVASLLAETSLSSQFQSVPRQPLAFRYNHIVGESAKMRELLELSARVASTNATVLIRGEQGSGKEAIARVIHYNSARRRCPFVTVDCSDLDREDRDRDIRAADGGTLFFDEIGALSGVEQAWLVRLLTEVRFGRGETPNVRAICASTHDLEGMRSEGTLRADLHNLLSVVALDIPPLRGRGAVDLDRLIDHFLFRFKCRHGRGTLQLSERARRAFHVHDWPGNVGELRDVIESAVVLSTGPLIEPGDLRMGSHAGPRPPRLLETDRAGSDRFATGLVPLATLERHYITHVVSACGGNRSEAARRLGIGRNTLARKLLGD